jgi:chromosome segregation ATPase
MIGSDELAREREERIEKYKADLHQMKIDLEKIIIEHESLKINHDKVKEQYQNSQKDLDDTTEKLHLTNKVRHETEIKLGEEVEKCKGLQEIVKIKEDSLGKKATEIEELDKRVIDLERA